MEGWYNRFVSRIGDNGDSRFEHSRKHPDGRSERVILQGAIEIGIVPAYLPNRLQRNPKDIVSDAEIIAGRPDFYLTTPETGEHGHYAVIVVDNR